LNVAPTLRDAGGRKSRHESTLNSGNILKLLSEKSRILRNHFYNHAFSNVTLVKVSDVRKIIDEMYRLAKHSHDD